MKDFNIKPFGNYNESGWPISELWDDFYDCFSYHRPARPQEIDKMTNLTLHQVVKDLCQCRERVCMKPVMEKFKIEVDDDDCYPDEDCDSCHGCNSRMARHNDTCRFTMIKYAPWEDAFDMDDPEKPVRRSWLVQHGFLKRKEEEEEEK